MLSRFSRHSLSRSSTTSTFSAANVVMSSSTSSNLPSELLTLLQRDGTASLPPLRPQKPYSVELKSSISSLTPCLPIAVVGMLHLLNDDIDAAHALVQDDDSNKDSNLIHSILHRREGDFWNSKWWLNQFSHDFLNELYKHRNMDGRTGAKQFVDMVERVTSQGAVSACAAQSDVNLAKEWQWKEHSNLAHYVLDKYKVTLSSS